MTSKFSLIEGLISEGIKERFGPILSCNTTSDHWAKRGWTVFSRPVLGDKLIFTTSKAYELTVKVCYFRINNTSVHSQHSETAESLRPNHLANIH